MKNLKIELYVFFAIVLIPVLAICQSASPIPSATPGVSGAASSVSPSWILSFVTAHPWAASIIMVIGTLRLILKPAFSALHSFLQGAGFTAWDSEVTAVEQSKVMSVVYFLLDYLGSIKIPVAAIPVAQVQTAPTTPVA